MANRHRALDDTLALFQFLKLTSNNFTTSKITKLVTQIKQSTSLPEHIAKKTISSLPQTHGVYTFYDRSHQPIYIGKSTNLRQRVMSHFYTDISITKELKIKQNTHYIDYQTTAGELSSLLTESTLIKQHSPHYNHQLKQTSHFIQVIPAHSPNHYKTIRTHQSQSLLQEDISQTLAIFKSTRQLTQTLHQLAKTNQLCLKLLGLEKTTHSCFGYHLKLCRGACINKESPTTYNLRFDLAFLPYKLTLWPYPGAIEISEYNPNTDQTQSHLFSHWCLLGSSDTSSQLPDPTGHPFNYDTYKILKRYLNSPLPPNSSIYPRPDITANLPSSHS